MHRIEMPAKSHPMGKGTLVNGCLILRRGAPTCEDPPAVEQGTAT